MRYRLGRLLQFLGLIVPVVGLAGNLVSAKEFGEGYMFKMLGAGIAVFYAGWLLQKGARPE